MFFCETREALLLVLHKVYAAGYPAEMVVQEFIPGDDSHMRVLTNYSDREGHVKLMCLGHVLLEEHTPHGIGNHAVILTEENRALCETMKGLLEAISFRGFSNFDLKYDSRDGQYKVFEINCRQGRSNYYVTGAGYNIATYLVEDLVLRKDLPLTIADRESLWSVVPKKVAFDYISSAYHAPMRARLQQGQKPNPLFYAEDKGFMRRLRMLKNLMSHHKKYRLYYEKKS